MVVGASVGGNARHMDQSLLFFANATLLAERAISSKKHPSALAGMMCSLFSVQIPRRSRLVDGRLLCWKQNALLPWKGLVGDLAVLNVNRNISARLLVMYTLPLPGRGGGQRDAVNGLTSYRLQQKQAVGKCGNNRSPACVMGLQAAVHRRRDAMKLPLLVPARARAPAPALLFCQPLPLSLKHAIAATMVIVWMYWMRCMRCLLGYMAMSSAVLLGLMGGAVWGSALDVFQLPCDAFTYYGALWNFAVVGVVAIFYQKVCVLVCVCVVVSRSCMRGVIPTSDLTVEIPVKDTGWRCGVSARERGKTKDPIERGRTDGGTDIKARWGSKGVTWGETGWTLLEPTGRPDSCSSGLTVPWKVKK